MLQSMQVQPLTANISLQAAEKALQLALALVSLKAKDILPVVSESSQESWVLEVPSLCFFEPLTPPWVWASMCYVELRRGCSFPHTFLGQEEGCRPRPVACGLDWPCERLK